MIERVPRIPANLLSLEALKDAFDYPLHGGAIAAILVLTGFRIVATGLPVFGVFLHLLLWLALYKYAMEAMAATGAGRFEPPDVVAQVEAAVHRSHLWVQLGIILLALATFEFAPEFAVPLIAASALTLPGAVLALAVMQNLLAAVNPGNWYIVAKRVGPGYALLVIAGATALFVQMSVRLRWLDLETTPWSTGAFHLVAQYLVLVWFRLLGIALHRNAEPLGYEYSVTRKPEIQRDREREHAQQEVARARDAGDLKASVKGLARALKRGADESVHREYRSLLRHQGDRAALHEHARVHASELCVLRRPELALALCREALDDDSRFALTDGDHTLLLFDLAERGGQDQIALAIADNYRTTYPKRKDGAALMLRAAILLSDRLQDRDAARKRLEGGLKVADADRPALEKALKRLDAHMPLTSRESGIGNRES